MPFFYKYKTSIGVTLSAFFLFFHFSVSAEGENVNDGYLCCCAECINGHVQGCHCEGSASNDEKSTAGLNFTKCGQKGSATVVLEMKTIRFILNSQHIEVFCGIILNRLAVANLALTLFLLSSFLPIVHHPP